MDENKENPIIVNKTKMLFKVVEIALFLTTIALILYMLTLYLPLKEECLKCVCNGTVDLGINLTNFTNLSYP